MSDDWTNKLYYGDNPEVMRRSIADECVLTIKPKNDGAGAFV